MERDRQAFLDAIRADWDADAPRLIYADWLDERGESLRASLVRYQVAGGRAILMSRCRHPDLFASVAGTVHGGFVDDCLLPLDADAALERRLRFEAVRTVAGWQPGETADIWDTSPTILRADRLTFTPGAIRVPAMLRLAEATACRTVRIVRHSNAAGRPSESRSAPVFSKTDGVELVGQWPTTPDDLAAIFHMIPNPIRVAEIWGADALGQAGPSLDRLDRCERLTLQTGTGAGFSTFLNRQWPCLAEFEMLAPSLHTWADDMIGSTWVRGLRTLRLTGSAGHLGDVHVANLARAAPRLEAFRCDRKSGRSGGDTFVGDLWPHLADLDLNGFTFDDLVRLTAGGLLPRLRRLRLAAASRVAVGPRRLFDALATGAALESLTLGDFTWSARDAEAYWQSEASHHLSHLEVATADPGRLWADLLRPDILPNLQALVIPAPPDAPRRDALIERWGPRVNLFWER